MKKVITIVVFIALAATAYGREIQALRTSSGKIWGVIYGLIGKYEGQAHVDDIRPLFQNPQYLTLSNKDHNEIVDIVLSYYKLSTGDTFKIIFTGSEQHGNYTPYYHFVCEITNDGKSYDYWLWYDR